MCTLLSWFARWVAEREKRDPRTEAAEVGPADADTLLPGVREYNQGTCLPGSSR
ncbi:hypothetical protein GCM10010353_23650 [Streptomyces chryseus]|uniref:Uncharacterized protein n=1 Tax=Streptomyces chryseus TaxID=68186 RepID=A0ABQ3DPP1_9ACTN|nr:hypothetical protein GCM10010353_23650 [Streptomyces chryseus]GHB00462.1 hypothetical protein GCM10010346_24230 [Streptomyces chryseus]